MRVDLTPRQTVAFDYILDEVTRSVLYGGAKGGGKSYLLCLSAYALCFSICNLFDLKPSLSPLPVGFLGRKRSTDFRKTTLETWMRVIPAGTYEIKHQAGEIILFNGACKVFFGGLDNTDAVNKFNSSELVFLAIDQAEETTREDVAVLRGALRLKHNGVQVPFKEIYTANPADCWLKEDFVDNTRDGHRFVPALPSDNPHLPDNYISTLEEAFKHAQPLLRAYRDGDWSALKSCNTLISSGDLEKLKDIDIAYSSNKRVIVCDPATSHDECVIYYMEDYQIRDQRIIVGHTDTMRIAGEIAMMAKKHDVVEIGGDSIGLGAGVFDRLAEIGTYSITKINSAERSSSKQFSNRRAEIYWTLMRAVIDKRIPYPDDAELRRQLINISYEVTDSSGEIKISFKDVIKKVIGRSPDRADCYAYGVWLSDRVEAYFKPRFKRDAYDTYVHEFNPATV